MKRKFLAVIGILTVLMGLSPGSVLAEATAPAQVVVPIAGPALTMNIVVVNDGVGGQTDPHASGDWVSYTDATVYGIRFQNLDLGTVSDRIIPHAEGEFDSMSDISGATIIFHHIANARQGVYLSQIDPLGNPGPATEVSPSANALPRHAVVGGDTIAYEDFGDETSNQHEIFLSSVVDPAAPAYRLTNDMLDDRWPGVSPDGNVVVWEKCESAVVCDVWRAERTNGAWGAPEQVTGVAGSEMVPETNGPVTVYWSIIGEENDIRWSVKDASGAYVEYVLALPGIQRNPNIAGSLISFESSAAFGAQFDVCLYDLATNRLYQLTNTSISESLTDIAISNSAPGGLVVVRVVWGQPKQVYPYDMDVYALTAVMPDTTPPEIAPTVSGTPGANGWYTSDVSLTWSVTDPNSSISSTTGCEAVSITQDQAATGYTCTATSEGGSASLTVSIARDASAPIITCPNPALLPGSGDRTVTAGVDAALSGLDEAASVLSGTVPTSGPQTLSFTAVDLAGNRATQECSFNVGYPFTGFFGPVENVPGVNSMKAGAAVPIKFSLGGDQGLDILAAGYPVSRPVSCAGLASDSDPVETVTAGSSSLSFDPATGQYTYVWKTDRQWAGTCRVLTVQLDDGSQHLANFQFK